MVPMAIKFLSDGNAIRSRNDSSSCSLNGASVVPPKWKPRNVSAVRDFPPGCGPVLLPVHVVPPKSEPSSSPVSNKVGGNEPERVGAQVDSLPQNTDTQVDSLPQNTDTQVVPKEDVNMVVKLDDVKLSVDNGETKMKFVKRRVSAVRDFPPYCGLNAPAPTEEERARINGRRSYETVDKSGGGRKVCEKSNGNVKDEFLEKNRSDELNNESPVANQETKSDAEKEKVENIEPSKRVHNIGQACQELVVYTREKLLTTPSSLDALEEDTEEDFQDNRPLALVQEDIKNVRNQKLGHEKRVQKRVLDDTNYLVSTGEKIKVVVALKAPSLCAPVSLEKVITNKGKEPASTTPKKSIKKKQKKQEKNVGESSSKSKVAYTGTLEMVVRKEEDLIVDTQEQEEELFNSPGANDMDITLFPFGPKSSSDARNKVREILRHFQILCRKLLQGEESKTDESKSVSIRRVDLAAKAILDKKGRTLTLGEKTYGPVPGVEVGDEFQYRVELALVGLHRPFQGGIDYVKQGNNFFAVSVVASGGYDNEVDKPDCLIYSGAGGIGKDKSYENQKPERGNLALMNSKKLRYPVRVIRGYKVKLAESSDSKSKLSTTYIYDGLYTVEDYSQVPGKHGNMVFRFELKRNPGQPQLAIREVKSKKFKTREGVCVKDITDGKEVFPICAINTIDDEKPPPFTYITKLVYPDSYQPVPPKGCDCVGRCSDKRCPCAFRNGGEIPYNRNGAIVEAKPLVYECGPSCRCPPSCYNRVTQHGMKIQLEIFKTESRGWGVRSLRSISSGSFICEYIGELLEDTEAEKRTGNDEYLFDIGQNYNDCSLNPETKSGEMVETGGFTIDAANYGNVGRFINHSCSPNLYAQNVLYDQEDKRMPHIMLFAAENIPPLQELTYHYNYAVDTVHDADGNIKIKNCYCGSSECTGRLY